MVNIIDMHHYRHAVVPEGALTGSYARKVRIRPTEFDVMCPVQLHRNGTTIVEMLHDLSSYMPNVRHNVIIACSQTR